MRKQAFIIAEAGVNHNGDLSLALEMVDIASKAKASAIKFQTFKTEELVTKSAPKAEYQLKNHQIDESQFSMLKKMELSEENHYKILERCKKKEIQFLSTPFDSKSLHFLVNDLKMETIKIPSGEITNGPFLLEISRLAKKIILSTGMSNLGDIEKALELIAFGINSQVTDLPTEANIFKVLSRRDIWTQLKEKVVILHATTEYPAPIDQINLSAMKTIQEAFKLPFGYSDHTNGIHIPIAAIAMGACVIEKHFTLDKNLPGPDHKASLEPNELQQMVQLIRETELAIGDGIKRPVASEVKNMLIARKSILASRPIKKGELYSKSNTVIKRPGNGISPMMYWDIIGKEAGSDFREGDCIF
jgi:2,4-diacetamido-2,4,6-trideoxy-beta-L-gulose transferase